MLLSELGPYFSDVAPEDRVSYNRRTARKAPYPTSTETGSIAGYGAVDDYWIAVHIAADTPSTKFGTITRNNCVAYSWITGHETTNTSTQCKIFMFLPDTIIGDDTVFYYCMAPCDTNASSLVVADIAMLDYGLAVDAHNPRPTVVFSNNTVSDCRTKEGPNSASITDYFTVLDLRAVAAKDSVAPTETGNTHEEDMARQYGDASRIKWRRRLIHGEVHDGNAFYGFNNVAGNAGLFSNADLTFSVYSLPKW